MQLECISELFGGYLGIDGIDEAVRAPFEASDFGQSGKNLESPVVACFPMLMKRAGVQNKVVSGFGMDGCIGFQYRSQDFGEFQATIIAQQCKRMLMIFGVIVIEKGNEAANGQ